jgi:hypothetical protein
VSGDGEKTLNEDILNQKTVLVLNRNRQAIDPATPVQAFGRMATDAARPVTARDKEPFPNGL